MSPPNPNLPLLLLLLFLPLLLISLSSLPSTSPSPLSTIAISHFSNTTIICALLPSSSSSSTTILNCTSLPNRTTHSYPSARLSPYSAITSGDDFLCALSSPLSSNTSTMRWWDFTHTTPTHPIPTAKRLYKGPTLSALDAGDSHVCGLQAGSGNLDCWRWPDLSLPPLLNLTKIDVGRDFICGILPGGPIQCFGRNQEIVGKEPVGNYSLVGAGSNHACGISSDGQLFRGNHVVFEKVLPGTCRPSSSCSCGFLDGSGNICSAAGEVICRSCDYRLRPNQPPSPPRPNSTAVYKRSGGGGNKRRRLAFILIGSIGFGIGLAAGSYLLYVRFRRRSGRVRVHDSALRVANRARTDPGLEIHLSALFNKGHSSTIEEFPIGDLLAVTDGFAESHKIGSGSFGSVYRAMLADGREVAIKRAASPACASASTSRAPRVQDRESAFLSELALLSRVNHKNLVRLLGFCRHAAERVIVYEFMTHGTLHDLLHKPRDSGAGLIGSWPGRIRVALDAARGIEYLHRYAVPPIIHRDIKSSNILLDDTWTAKVSDFGLSLMSPDPDGEADWSHISLRAAGTVGYMDPEYYRLQHLTAKSDVYSFGVVLLELLSGCRVIQRYEESGTPINVVEFAVPHIVADDIHRVLDPKLPPPTPSEIEAVAYVGYLAADCVSPQGKDRPTMCEVVSGLERALAACSGPELDRSDSIRSG